MKLIVWSEVAIVSQEYSRISKSRRWYQTEQSFNKVNRIHIIVSPSNQQSDLDFELDGLQILQLSLPQAKKLSKNTISRNG